MNKRFVLLITMLLLLTLLGCGISSLSRPKIDAPVFVKSMIYSEDMDIDLNYIAPRGYDKSIETIQIPNAPKGIDCVVYGEEKESEGQYSVATVHMGLNCEYWSEEEGIGSDLEINELLISWSDGSQAAENVGRITVMGGNKNCSNYMNMTGHDGLKKATFALTNDTEITGLDIHYQDEAFNLFSNIMINDMPLEDISRNHPIKLKKNDMCVIAYQGSDDNKSQYGNVIIGCYLMGKSDGTEEKIAYFTLNKKFEGMRDYLKSNLE